MITETSESGICITCNELGKCIFYKPESLAVFFCEEFDNYKCIQNKTILSKEPDKKNEYGDKTDLCINCDFTTVCLYDNKYAVKWYCEEHL